MIDLIGKIGELLDARYNGAIKNTMINRDMPYLTEFWETEALVAAIWEETLDGAGTGLFATGSGYMYWDIDTDAVGDNDVFINSKYRWQVRPGIFSDINTSIEKLIIEFEVQIVTAVADHDNTHFFLGLSSAKSNDITQNDLIGFYLNVDNLRGKCDAGGTESETGNITATLTNWNKFKIEIFDTSVVFSLNESPETAIATNLADVAMYLVFGTRAEAGVAVGLNIGNVRAWYQEVV